LLGVQVCQFPDHPTPGVLSLTTLGISDHVLKLGSFREVRQEFLIAFRPGAVDTEELVRALMRVAEIVLARGRAVLRGELLAIGDVGPSKADGLYASMPVMFPEGMATLNDSSPPTVFVWLIPLVGDERSFINDHGWNEFEERLEASSPDLFDLCRSAVA
jgi:hypothetical protein